MRLIPVNSTSIRCIGYDSDTWTLAVQFHDSDLYFYQGVQPDEMQEFIHADSFGAYFNRRIRDRYPFQKAA
jgi:hypothetical protein